MNDSIPQIENAKRPDELLNIVHTAQLPSDTPYGNLTLKSLDITRRIDHANREIQRVFAAYILPEDHDSLDPWQDLQRHQFLAEQVVYWLRKTADEIIALAHLADQFKSNGDWPSQLRIDSIGQLMNSGDRSLKYLFAEHLSFLDTLNEVSNAFKHSFINTDMSLVGSEGWIQVPIATFPKRRDIARRCVKLRLSRPSTKQALRCPIPILAHASAASFSRSRSSD